MIKLVGATSDKDAIVKIMNHLADGYVLVETNLCSRANCPVPLHMKFDKPDD